MHSAVEFVVKNVTDEMQAAQLWANSVFVRPSDTINIMSGRVAVAPSDKEVGSGADGRQWWHRGTRNARPWL